MPNDPVKEALGLEEELKSVDGFIISKVEELYSVKYVGLYDIRPASIAPMLVFYQADPNLELGHSHYMGLYRHGVSGVPYVTNAELILEREYPAVPLEDGTFIVSRYRHDYQTGPRGEMVDGGIDYTRCNPQFPPTHVAIVRDDQEVILPSFKYAWLCELDEKFAAWKGEYNTACHWMGEEWWRSLWRAGKSTDEALVAYKERVKIFTPPTESNDERS